MGHDDFSTNEDFAAAVAQAQLAADVTSIEGTRVEPLERETDPENLLGDAVIFGDAGIVGEGGLSIAQTLARLAKTDPDMALDMMSNRSYRAGRGLLNGFTRTGSYSGYSLGQRMGESFDDYLERIYSDEHLAKESKKDRTEIEKTLKRLEKSTKELESIDKEIAKNLDDLAKSSRRTTFDLLTPPGTTDIFNPETEKWEVVKEQIESLLPATPAGTTDIFNAETGEWKSVYEKMVDRPPENVYEAMAPVRDRPEAMPLGTPAGVTDIFNPETGQWEYTDDYTVPSDPTGLPETPAGTPDVFNAETGNWETTGVPVVDISKAIEDLQKQSDLSKIVKSETYPFTSPITSEGALTGPATQEELNALIGTTQYEDESIFQRLLAETLGLPVDMINAAISSILTAAGAPQHIIENPVGGRAWLMANKGMTIDDLVNAIGDMVSPTTPSGVVVPATVDTQWPAIPSLAAQSNVDEEYFPGAGMTAEESIERTRVLNTANILNPPHYPGTRPLDLEEDPNKIDQVHQQGLTGNVLDGLSQAMQDILNTDPELMAQYMAARNDIMAQLNKTGYKEHEDWYPGSQAAATQAGFWGPMALGWNPKYNEYKDAQRTLMGLEAGQRFKSDDWIQTFGWMTPEQINRISGYGNQ
jgi:hypothetical protein